MGASVYIKEEKKWEMTKEIKTIGEEMLLLAWELRRERTPVPESQHRGWLWKVEIFVLSLWKNRKRRKGQMYKRSHFEVQWRSLWLKVFIWAKQKWKPLEVFGCNLQFNSFLQISRAGWAVYQRHVMKMEFLIIPHKPLS